jgi:CRISPR-associated protein Cas5d
MSQGIKLHVTGEFACFTRPEMKVERVSYDIITPSAARGILEAIYWKPQIRWIIDKIHVLAPIRFTSVRRNEVADKASKPSAAQMRGEKGKTLGILVEDRRQQRASLILREVSYGIEAHIEILDHRFERSGSKLSETECVGKHLGQFERRARTGGHFHQPYLGTREFPANCEWIDQDRDFPASTLPVGDLGKDFGWMLHDLDYIETTEKTGSFIESNQGRRIKTEPRFFRAQLQNGVLDVHACLANSNLENS